MNFEHRCTVPVGRETLWAFLMDVPAMSGCVPGASEVAATDADRFTGRMKVKFGPIRLTLQGTLTVDERDRANWRAVGKAEANDRRVGGGVHINAELALLESRNETDGAAAQTELVVTTEARMMGRLGEFGQSVIRKRADKIVAEFAQNVAERFRSAESGE